MFIQVWSRSFLHVVACLTMLNVSAQVETQMLCQLFIYFSFSFSSKTLPVRKYNNSSPMRAVFCECNLLQFVPICDLKYRLCGQNKHFLQVFYDLVNILLCHTACSTFLQLNVEKKSQTKRFKSHLPFSIYLLHAKSTKLSVVSKPPLTQTPPSRLLAQANAS